MSNNEIKENIQEMEQGEKDFGIVNSAKSLHKKIVSNDLVSEFDAFSVPIKLTLNGEQVYKTCCGGIMYLLLAVICIIITIFIIFPNGIQLNSELDVIDVPTDAGDTGQTLFDIIDGEIITFRGMNKNYTSIIGYDNVSSYITMKAYMRGSDNMTVELELSMDCSTPGAEFCLKNSAINSQATIFGDYFSDDVNTRYLTFEAIWCDPSQPTCPPEYYYYVMQVSLTNFYKKKGGQLQQYRITNIFSFINAKYINNVTREQFTTNNKFMGHLANILPFEIDTYLFTNQVSRTYFDIANLTTPNIPIDSGFFQLNIVPCSSTKQINQNFDDISQVLLFFLSVNQTLYAIIFIIFIQQYNRNSGLLEIGARLFYVDDPKTKKKYDFNRGYEVFVACLFHNHPVTNFIQFIFNKMGKTLQDFFPTKTYCAIKLMGKAEEILQQNSFYGNLNELSSMQGEISKKIPLNEELQAEKDPEVTELDYFPILHQDCVIIKREKQIKKEAFKQFCEANQHISPQRKNFIYNVLTNNKLSYTLVHEIQKQFKAFLRNARIQISEDIYKQSEEEEFSEIIVAVNDTNNNQITAQNFIKT